MAKKTDKEKRSKATQADIKVPKPASADLVWQGADDETLPYRATASHVDVRADDGKLLGKMFNLAYVALKDGEPDPARPVTFAFNGGPGSASVPINLGGIGPKRVRPNGLGPIPADAPFEDNPHSIIAATDLVFLDALGTGWSKVAEGVGDDKVFGVDADADCFARAICAWLQDNGRWSSPVYLYGESYGTVRNSILIRLLGERSVKLTGVVMLSALFDWVQTLPGSDTYYLGMMPTYAATAQHFGVVGADVDPDEWFDEAMCFTEDVLAPALLKGDRMPAEEDLSVAERLSEFIGIPVEHVLAKHLRIELTDFRATLLANEGKVCGRIDTRFVSDAPSFAQTSTEWLAAEDASVDPVESAWVSAFRAFCSDVLGYQGPARYFSSNYMKIGAAWKWSHVMPGTGQEAPAPNVALDIAVALRRDPTIKLAIIGGRYDAATTWWNVVHDISCQYLSDELKERIRWYRYGCGHMAYIDEPTNVALGADMREFYRMK